MTARSLFIVAAGLFATGAPAADPKSLNDELRRCVSLTDDERRLACFDAATTRLQQPAAEPGETSPPAASNTSAQTAADQASAEDAVGNFGMTRELRSSQAEDERDEELREISAVVVEVTERPRGEKIVTLDIGQVWTEKHHERAFRVRVGDTVVIKKNALGGYRMVGRGRRASAVTRLR